MFMRCSVRQRSHKRATDSLHRGPFPSGLVVIFPLTWQIDLYSLSDISHSLMTCCMMSCMPLLLQTDFIYLDVPQKSDSDFFFTAVLFMHGCLSSTSSPPLFLLLFAKYPELPSALHICVILQSALPLPLL